MAKPKKIHTIASLLERTEDYGQCKEWTGYLANKRSPAVYHDGRLRPVRQIICQLQNKEVQPTNFVSTSCGNPKCIHPLHIEIRSRVEHMTVMASKVEHLHPSRLLKLTEKAQVRRKLTDDQLQEIMMGSRSRRDLAKEFAVNPSLISRIRAGKAHRMSAARNNPFFRLMG